MKPNFELVTELQTIQRRDFPVADAAYLKPYDSSAILDGEWLKLDSYKLARGAAETEALVFPVHTERGRYDVQAVQKASVLFLGVYEAETAIYEGALAVGDLLTVQNIAAGTFTGKRGLKKASVGAARVVVGVVSKAPANGRVRFVHFSNNICDIA